METLTFRTLGINAYHCIIRPLVQNPAAYSTVPHARRQFTKFILVINDYNSLFLLVYVLTHRNTANALNHSIVQSAEYILCAV